MASLNNTISANDLRRMLHYAPDTGVFTWLQRTECPRSWNTKYAGRQAGTPTTQGVKRYIKISIGARPYKAHRLAWLYMTGEWPTTEIDHKDGDGLNNCFANIRLAVRSLNNANRVTDKRPGLYRGVYYTPEGGYYAKIKYQRKQRYLGRFDTPEAARDAYIAAAIATFGEFATID